MKEKYTKLFCLFILFITNYCYAQSYSHFQITNEKSDNFIIYISGAIGYKYQVQSINSISKTENKVFQDHRSFIFNSALAFGENHKHIIGLEIMGFPWKYGNDPMPPKYFTLIFSPFYRRNIPILGNLVFFSETGVSIFSNDPSNILTISLDSGLCYDLANYEIFIQNNFRFAPSFFLNTPPWFFVVGSSIKL